MLLTAKEKHQRIVLILFIQLFVIIALIGVLFYQLIHRAPPSYGALFEDEQGQLRVYGLSPLLGPIITRTSLLEWAGLAATSAYTFDAANYQQQLSATMEQYFTQEGSDAFVNSLNISGTIRSVVSKQLTVTAVLQGMPVILGEGPLNGTYSWKVQMPVLVTYQGLSGSPTTARLVVTLLIVGVPTSRNPHAIGVAQYWSTAG
jgi:intracellular multiplication protein IcmL